MTDDERVVREKLYLQDTAARAEAISGHGQAIFYALFSLNGGAILALLTLVGSLQPDSISTELRGAFVIFGLGLVVTVLAHIARYRGNAAFINQSYNMLIAMNCDGGEELFKKANKQLEQGKKLFDYSLWGMFGSLLLFLLGSFFGLSSIN